jgi:hypothetical protein
LTAEQGREFVVGVHRFVSLYMALVPVAVAHRLWRAASV